MWHNETNWRFQMSRFKLIFLSLALSITAISAWAGQITLKSTTSTVELVGDLKSFDNGIYIIETELGELEVDARTVTCSGASCPKVQSLSSKISILGEQDLLNQLLIPLLESYSFSLDANVETKTINKTQSTIKVINQGGQEYASINVQSKSHKKLNDQATNAKDTLVITSSTLEMLAASAKDGGVTPLAADALIAITSDTNSVKTISLSALQDILSGKISNWKDIGGPDISINLYLPKDASALQSIAKEMGYEASKFAKSQQFDSLKELSMAAASDPYGLGFTNYSNLHNANALAISGGCGAYIKPSTFNILSGSYPIAYYHYLKTSSEATPIFAREFLTYLESSQAKDAINQLGYPSLSVFESDLDDQGNRIAYGLLATSKTVPVTEYRAMMNVLIGARQLSTVLRFKAGSLDLDVQSSAALEALVSELFLGNYADQTLLILGFTDADGSTGENKRNSKAAAKLISRYIKDADSGNQLMDLQINAHGFGEASPLVCEDTPLGAATNNRVEIWVKDKN